MTNIIVLKAGTDVEEPGEIKIIISDGPKFTSNRLMVSKKNEAAVLNVLEEVNTMLRVLTQATRLENEND